MSELCCIRTVGNHTSMKMKGLPLYAMWLNLTHVIVNERSQTQRYDPINMKYKETKLIYAVRNEASGYPW